MALTIYVLGDIPTFSAVLNAVAMVWQTGMMSGPGLGLGAAAGLGLLVTLAVLLMKAPIAMATGGSSGPGSFAIILILIIVYSVGSQPVTVQIEDVYTGTATTVANVPFAVAVPGSIISTITRSVALKMETGFSTVDGNYIALTSDGFASPLQLMLSMRGGKYGLPDADPFLTANLKVFVLDCVARRPGFDAKAFAQQNIPGIADPISYITSPGVYGGGLTDIFSPANPSGIGTDCTTAATNLKNSMANFVAPGSVSGMAGFINANMNKRASPNTAIPNSYSPGDIEHVHAQLINGIWGSSQDAQSFMLTALTSAHISDSYNCALSNTSIATYVQCTTVMTQAMEQWKIDSAGSATGFTKSMVPAMTVLLAIFYAFSPIMFVFAMMTGAHGLSILTKYLLFGLWSQTWLPFAVVINFIAQVMVKNEFLRLAAVAPNGLNPATVPAFYDMLSIKLAIVSEMLAAVPLISMALLSGSVYGLTKIAGNMGKDHVDEKGAAPNTQETGALSSSGSMLSAPARSTHDYASNMTFTTGAEQNLASIGVGTALDNSIASNISKGHDKSVQASQQEQHVLSNVMGVTDSKSVYDKVGHTLLNSNNATAAASVKAAELLTHKSAASDETTRSLAGKIFAGASIKGSGEDSSSTDASGKPNKDNIVNKVMSSARRAMGVDAGTQISFSNDEKQKISDSIDKAQSTGRDESATNTNSVTDSTTSGQGTDKATQLQHALQAQDTSSIGLLRSEADKYSTAAQQAEARKNSMGTNTNIRSDRFVDQLRGTDDGQQHLLHMQSSVVSDAAMKEEYERRLPQVRQMLAPGPDREENAKAVAALETFAKHRDVEMANILTGGQMKAPVVGDMTDNTGFGTGSIMGAGAAASGSVNTATTNVGSGVAGAGALGHVKEGSFKVSKGAPAAPAAPGALSGNFGTRTTNAASHGGPSKEAVQALSVQKGNMSGNLDDGGETASQILHGEATVLTGGAVAIGAVGTAIGEAAAKGVIALKGMNADGSPRQ